MNARADRRQSPPHADRGRAAPPTGSGRGDRARDRRRGGDRRVGRRGPARSRRHARACCSLHVSARPARTSPRARASGRPHRLASRRPRRRRRTRDVLDGPRVRHEPEPVARPRRLAVLLFTAGPGAPKPAMLTHGSLSNLEQMQAHPGLRISRRRRLGPAVFHVSASTSCRSRSRRRAVARRPLPSRPRRSTACAPTASP